MRQVYWTREQRAPAASMSFNRALRDAINAVATSGYESVEQIDRLTINLRSLAEYYIADKATTENKIKSEMDAIFRRLIDNNGVNKLIPELSRYSTAIIRTQLLSEVERRKAAATDMINRWREVTINDAVHHFRGWATSIPIGGDKSVSPSVITKAIKKHFTNYTTRRNIISCDQGHKLSVNLTHIAAMNNGCIAARWHSNFHVPHYDYRETHKDRHDKLYAIAGNWALQQGLMTKCNGATNLMTAPGEEINCRCFYSYISSIDQLPDQYLTRAGQEYVSSKDNYHDIQRFSR